MGTFKEDRLMLRINEATWDDAEHTVIILHVSDIDDRGEEIKSFYYATNESDPTPMNRELWTLVNKEPEKIQENPVVLMTNGELPVPEGHTLKNGILYHDETQELLAKEAINRRLDELYSGHVLARAESDPVYESNRKADIQELLSLEKQRGFPYNLDLANLGVLREIDDNITNKLM